MKNKILQKLDAGINAAEQTGITISQVELHPDTLEEFWNSMLVAADGCEFRAKKVKGRYRHIPLKPSPKVPENRVNFVFPHGAGLQAWEELVDDWTKSS